MVEEHAVSELHFVQHEVARLVVAHAGPRCDAAGRRERVVDRALVGLAFHEPVFHARREEVPRCGGGLAPEPWLNRVVAFRSHQVRPARPRRGTITTVTTKSAT